MIHIGIDYSMTCPAVCACSPDTTPMFWYAHERKYQVDLAGVTAIAIPSFNIDGSACTVVQRATYLARHCVEWIRRRGVTDVAIEDYAFAATGRVFHIGENTGILKYRLNEFEINVHPVPPTVIKKFATGKGNADKPKMVAAFLSEYPEARNWIPVFFPRTKSDQSPAKSPLADLADAYWIAKYASK